MIWATTTDPSSSVDRAFAITTDNAGYVYVTGNCALCGPSVGYATYTYIYKIDPENGDMVGVTTSGAIMSVGAKNKRCY